jgi:hypothetical protein
LNQATDTITESTVAHAVEELIRHEAADYICSEGADIADPDDPAWRPMRRTRTPAKRTRQVAVGYRIGTALRHARVGGAGRGGTHASPAAHLRRAHWHHYWVGPRNGERRLELRWIPPVAVGALPDTVGVLGVRGAPQYIGVGRAVRPASRGRGGLSSEHLAVLGCCPRCGLMVPLTTSEGGRYGDRCISGQQGERVE